MGGHTVNNVLCPVAVGVNGVDHDVKGVKGSGNFEGESDPRVSGNIRRGLKSYIPLCSGGS